MRNIVAMGIVILLLLTGGKCESSTPPSMPGQGYPPPAATPNNQPHNKPNPKAPKELQQPAPPPADPGPYQDPKQAVFKLIWQGERSGSVEYSIGGAPQKIPMPQPVKGGSGQYKGSWEKTITVIPGSTIGFTWFPNAGGMWAMCSLYHDGQIEDYQIVPGGSCAVSFKG